MSSKDTKRWAKALDEVAHLYDKQNGGTLCGSVAACLGNNYAVKSMPTCEKCLDIAEDLYIAEMEERQDAMIHGNSDYEERLIRHERDDEIMD